LHGLSNDADGVDVDGLTALRGSPTMDCDPRHTGADGLATQIDSVADTHTHRHTVVSVVYGTSHAQFTHI